MRARAVRLTTGPRWRRVALAIVAGEMLPILALILVVAIAGGGDADSRNAFAQRAGAWVGPIAGAISVFGLSIWAGRPVPQHAILQSAVIGIGIALVDASILASSGAGFRWLFVISNGGKIVAALAGGLVAARASWGFGSPL